MPWANVSCGRRECLPFYFFSLSPHNYVISDDELVERLHYGPFCLWFYRANLHTTAVLAIFSFATFSFYSLNYFC